jgi:hypothetical protein
MSYLVDPEYAEAVGQHKWRRAGGYLITTLGSRPDRTNIAMHQMIWRLAHGRDLPKPLALDHINRDKTDNRIENLRPATKRLNALNISGGWSKSGLPRGVFRQSESCRFGAKLRISRTVQRRLGAFDTPEEASAAFQKALAEAVALEAEKAMNIWQEAMSDE